MKNGEASRYPRATPARTASGPIVYNRIVSGVQMQDCSRPVDDALR